MIHLILVTSNSLGLTPRFEKRVTRQRTHVTNKIPLAMPSMPPSAIAAIEIVTSHKLKLPSISAGCASCPRMARKPGYEPDVVPSVMEFFVIDGLARGGVRRALYQEYRAACSDT